VLEGRPPKPLVFVRPSDSLARVVRTLFQHKCSMAPILSGEPGQPSASVLHIATLSGVLTCLMRHFRASLASLPLLAQPLGTLPLGTWAPDSQFTPAEGSTAAAAGADAGGLANGAVVAKDRAPAAAAGKGGSDGAVAGRTVAPLHAVTPGMALTSALGMLLDAGVRRRTGRAVLIACLLACFSRSACVLRLLTARHDVRFCQLRPSCVKPA
jgi:hypothetical protein